VSCSNRRHSVGSLARNASTGSVVDNKSKMRTDRQTDRQTDVHAKVTTAHPAHSNASPKH
jgi:hypothetical protein